MATPDLRATGLAVVAAAALVLSGCSDEPDTPGDRTAEAAEGFVVDGTETFVQLPHGRVVLTVADATQVAPGDLADGGELEGPAVAVSWEWQLGEGVPAGQSGLVIADDVEAQLSVVVDGVEADLGAVYPTPSGSIGGAPVLVAAPDGTTSGDVALEVAFDGVTQRVRGDGSDRDAGRAEALYDDLGAAPVACEATLRPISVEAVSDAQPSCEASAVALPWLSDLGWAAEGSTWLALTTTTVLADVVVDGDPVPTSGVTEEMTLDGVEPAVVLVDQTASDVASTQNVFEADLDAPWQVTMSRAVRLLDDDLPGVDITASFVVDRSRG